MTNPFAVQPGGVISMPGAGDALASSLANVLAQQQVQRENAYRMQQLAIQQQQQAALAQYYQGQLSIQSREQGRLEGEVASKRSAAAQVGTAVEHYINPASMGTVQPGPIQQVLQGGAQAMGGPAGYASIFSGVAPENLLPAVQAVQGLQPKPEELPTNAKEFMFAQQLQAMDPSGKLAKFFVENWVNPPKAPGTVVNVGGQPTPYSKAYDEKAAGTTFGALEKAKQGFTAMPGIEEAYKIVRSGNAYTGLFAKPSLLIGRIAASAGVPEAQIKVSDTQTLMKLTGEQMLGYLRNRDLGSGTAVSDGDREFVGTLSGRELSQEPLAIRKTLRINFGMAIMNQTDAIRQLRQDAANYPERAAQISRDISRIQKEQAIGWRTYARMLKEEGQTEDEIRARMIGSDVPDPEPIIKSVRDVKPNIRALGDQIFGQPGVR